MNWHRHIETEQLLNEFGIKFTYKAGIPIQSIQIEASRKINNRFGNALDDNFLSRYEHAMRMGRSFPAIVTTQDYLILGGNNRTESARRAGWKTVDAYVVEAITDQQRLEFVRRDNNQHGWGLTEDEVVTTCVEIYRGSGNEKTLKQLNEEFFGGSERTYTLIVSAHQAADVRKRLDGMAVESRKLTQAHCVALNRIKDNANVLKEAAMVAAEFGMPSTGLDKLVSEVIKLPTERDKIDHIKQIRHRKVDDAHGVKKDPHVLLREQLVRFSEFLTRGGYEKLGPSASAKDDQAIRGMLSSLILKLRAIKTGQSSKAKKA